MNEKLSPERSVRLLRAKAAELEMLVTMAHPDYSAVDAAADIALIAGLLADHMEESIMWREMVKANVRDMRDE